MSSSQESTNSSDGAGTHSSLVTRDITRDITRGDSYPRSIRSYTAPPLDRQQNFKMRKSSVASVRSRSSGSSLGSSASQKPLTVTYKSVTTTGKLFSKKTTSVDCGAFVKDSG